MTEEELDPAWPEHAALFLDIDGTLLEFAETPDGVEISCGVSIESSTAPLRS
jgi:trehalose-6-phosphatase